MFGFGTEISRVKSAKGGNRDRTKKGPFEELEQNLSFGQLTGITASPRTSQAVAPGSHWLGEDNLV